jgi:hypothetical protein
MLDEEGSGRKLISKAPQQLQRMGRSAGEI